MRLTNLTAGLLLALALVGCSGGEDDKKADETPASESPSEAASPSDVETADRIAALIKTAVNVEAIEVTEDNDPNDLLGRPTGYDAAVILKDARLKCADLGIDCGASVEQWSDPAEVKERSDYIQGLLKDNPAFGTEYHYPVGNVLVRVWGDLKPGEAAEYEAAVKLAG